MYTDIAYMFAYKKNIQDRIHKNSIKGEKQCGLRKDMKEILNCIPFYNF